MDRIVRDLHLGPRPAVNRAYAGLRKRGYVIMGDASRLSLYWVNGNLMTSYQLLALAVMRGVRIKRR